jgi:hypothetical protein
MPPSFRSHPEMGTRRWRSHRSRSTADDQPVVDGWKAGVTSVTIWAAWWPFGQHCGEGILEVDMHITIGPVKGLGKIALEAEPTRRIGLGSRPIGRSVRLGQLR